MDGDLLKNILKYDKNTGLFTSLKTNKELGWTHSEGYIAIEIIGKKYYAHRLAWMYEYGYFPENGIDHINKNRSDNRIKNLREAGKRCNGQNCKISKNNKSGVTGVYFDKRNNKWKAQIKIDKKMIYLGQFDELYDAVLARWNEEQDNPEWKCSISSSANNYLKDNKC